MLGHEGGDRLGPEQRCVTGNHDDVGVIGIVVRKGGEGDGRRIARAPLNVLLDELDHHVPGGLLLQRLGDALGAMADDDHHPIDGDLGESVEHVQQHRATAHEVQWLRPARAHARALTRREHYRRKRTPTGHGDPPFAMPPLRPCSTPSRGK